MTHRLLHYDAIKDEWCMAELRELDNEDDKAIDFQQAWLDHEAQRTKTQQRWNTIYNGVTFALALVLIGLVLIVLGVLQ
jgi:hypothetical protein